MVAAADFGGDDGRRGNGDVRGTPGGRTDRAGVGRQRCGTADGALRASRFATLAGMLDAVLERAELRDHEHDGERLE